MKEEFKKFVRNRPYLIDYVTSNKMTWQQFYEIYDLYGEDNSIWDNFKNTNNNSNNNNNLLGTFKDILNIFKGIDVKKVQDTLTSLSKAIDVFKTDNNASNDNYEERPKYKYFED